MMLTCIDLHIVFIDKKKEEGFLKLTDNQSKRRKNAHLMCVLPFYFITIVPQSPME